MKDATLVLEGGATRGVFTAGVLDYIMERDLYLSHVIGVSAGSCNGIDYVSKQIGRTRDCMIHKEKEYEYVTFRKFLRKKQLIDMDMIFDKFPNEIFPFDFNTYFESEIECEIVATNCETGKAEYLTEHNNKERLMKICRASSSMPLLSPIVNIDGIPYLDGGLADSIPIGRALNAPNKKIVLVLTRNPGYRKKVISRGTANVYRRAYRKYPKLINAILRRAYHYNKNIELIEKLEEEDKIYVIRPLIKTVNRLEKNYEVLMNFYQHGYHQMQKQYDGLLKYLDE